MSASKRIRFGVSPIAWANDDMPELGGNTPLETILRAYDNMHDVPRPDFLPPRLLQQRTKFRLYRAA